MPTRSQAGISDQAVEKATGRNWSQWFALLDKSGARGKTHREVAEGLSRRHPGVSGWWRQMITVAWEQARGLRKKHQSEGGYKISAGKTLPISLASLYGAWANDRARANWLDERGLEVRKATANKSMRITWSDGATCIEVNFYAKGPAKAQVVVQHTKLKSAAEAARKKAYWRAALVRLAVHAGG
jgi:hypothetical protein